MKKRTLSMALALCLALSLAIPAYAAGNPPVISDEMHQGYVDIDDSISQDEGLIFSPTPNYTHEEIGEILSTLSNTVSYSEYDMYLKEKATAKQILRSPNASASEKLSANLILAQNPAEKIYSLQTKSDSELQDLGLSDERIQIIRTFQGTDAELRALSATCTVGANSPKYTANASGNWAKVSFYFQWDKPPILHYKDAMVAGASTLFHFQRVPDCKCTINYKSDVPRVSLALSKSFTSSSAVQNPFSNGQVAAFPYNSVERKTASDGRSYPCYAMSGSAVIVFKSVDARQVTLSYGHAHATRSITAELGVDFSSGGFSVGAGFGLTDISYDIVGKSHNSYTFPA